MSQVQYTQEQLDVLNAEGKIIVSASAGSGKTFVMIERMLRKILSGAEVDRMLALTFTKKAATQMREKIQKSVITKLNAPETGEAERAMLKRQLNRLPMAQISTIHAFCSNFIRSHFFLADVNGAFEIISDEDAEGKSLQSLAMEQIFFEAYENKDEGFLKLLSVYYRKKKDDNLKNILFALYRSLRTHANYKEKLLKIKAGEEGLFERVTNSLFKRFQLECSYILSRITALYSQLETVGNVNTLALISQMTDFIGEILRQTDYFSLCALPVPAFNRKEVIRSKERAEEKTLVDEVAFYKTNLVELCKNHFNQNPSFYQEEERRLSCAQSTASLLAELLLRFDERYTALKKEKAKLDYNDLEHIALSLLDIPSVAAEIQQKFDYVFVDEYQDINPVQEKIISLVSNKNLFLVGDVKQSIYGFRGSKSVYFTQKQKEFSSIGQSLHLTSNFRSAQSVLSIVNRVFFRAMTSDFNGIDYAAKPMQGGQGYGENTGRVRMHLICNEKAEPKERKVYSVLEDYAATIEKTPENVQAKEILNIIEEELHSQYYDIEEKKFKRVTYGDIAVLSRKKSGNISKIVAYLSQNGIPVSSTAKVNLCLFAEIRQITDILSLIDNREQDVPLCSALLSEMGGLTNAELAKIRLRYERRSPFRTCVKLYAEQLADELAQKLKNFYTLLQKYVNLSQILSAGELIERLVGETGIENDWLSREGGARRINRIRSFALQAQDKNVHDFLDYLKSLNYEIFITENAGENAVKILTMHASKGLEFPVVILADLNAPFHGADRDEVYFSEKYGIAPKCYDAEKKLVHDTLLRKLITIEQRDEEVKDEVNLLYVAMTRAKYALHLIKDEKDCKHSEPFYAQKHANFLPLCLFEDCIAPPYEKISDFTQRQGIIAEVDEALKEEILSVFQKPYPYQAEVSLLVKSSASNVMQTNSVAQEYYKTTPLVVEEEEGAKKREIGTAYHAFLEHADFSCSAKKELLRMKREHILPEEQLALIEEDTAEKILSMSVFKRLKYAQLYKEQPFLVLLPANFFFDTTSREEVLFQGFIDLLAISENGVEIVDYKYSSASPQHIKEHYAVQIKLYKKAVAKIMKIDEKTIKTTIVNIQRGEEIPM